jgi:class 3 adenylate cyclase
MSAVPEEQPGNKIEMAPQGGEANLNGAEHAAKKRMTHHTHHAVPESPLATKMMTMLESTPAQVLLNVITGYALFGDDVRTAGFDGGNKFVADSAFLAVSSFAFFLFNLELLIQVLFKEDYFPWPRKEGMTRWEQLKSFDFPQGSFYFWLDLIATWSLVFELTWMLEWIGGGRDPMLPPPTKVNLGPVTNEYTDDQDDVSAGGDSGVDGSAAQSARAGRASRAGAKAGRIVRIVRMVRLIRIVKVFKAAEASGMTGEDDTGPETIAPEDEEEEMLPESHVGKSLSELTQRRVIVGVLTTLLTLPLLDYPYSNETGMFTTRMAHSFLYRNGVCDEQTELARIGQGCSYLSTGLSTANDLIEKGGSHVMKLVAAKHFVRTAKAGWDSDCLNKLGNGGVSSDCEYDSEVYTVFYDPRNSYGCGAVKDPESPATCTDATGSIERDYVLRSNAHTTVIFKGYDDTTGDRFKTVTHWDISSLKTNESINSILLTLFVIILLGAGTFIFNEDTKRLVIGPIEQMMMSVTKIAEDPLSAGNGVKVDAGQEGMETLFLLQTIDKIGNLMRIGFGEAGGEIIAANLKDSHDDKLNIENILTGRGIVSIFGFCDIRNFTDTTECLQQEVMTFVNKVAYLLHNIVKDCKGAANKNIGDAFLLSWKVPNEICDTKTGKITGETDLFDNALYAFLKFTVVLRRYDSFITEFSKESNKRLYQRMPDYRCAMGMGLHVGIAVEGAIGTSQKIDATYISLHVNNSEFLESSTKAYKVPLLMSNFFQMHLSPEAKKMTRQIDYVNVTEELLFELWTYDVDYGADYGIEANVQLCDPDKVPDAAMAAEVRRLLAKGQEADDGDEQKDASGVLLLKEPVPPVITFMEKKKGYHTGVWTQEQDMKTLRHKMAHPDFMESWELVIKAYLDGDWKDCIERIAKFQKKYGEMNNGESDGPSEFLEKFIHSHPKDASGNIIDDKNHKDKKRVPHFP